MQSLRDNRRTLLHAHSSNVIGDAEFLLLYDINSSGNPDLPYWSYNSFNLERFTDDECKNEFRFLKNDIYNFCVVLNFL